MSTVIKVENLGKKYMIKHQQQERYLALRDVMANSFKSVGPRLLTSFGKNKEELSNPTKEEFWALQEINFEVQQGDRVGIIGRNGAGKSTLLKIISRITEPTTGRVAIKGRVASLLEVGTGFHPELTGRENIYLNGAVMGMHKHEIDKKFDEIVAFAEVEKFLDTPVKRYSSGMYVRLAFAVAAHLEPEILIVDEVLAVGDAQFQKKCLGKMGEVSKNGRTVLFVSHNMGAIMQLCNSGILLTDGHLTDYDNNINNIIKKYLFNPGDKDNSEWINQKEYLYKNEWFQPIRFCITNANGNNLSMPVTNNDDIWIQLEGKVKHIDPALTIGYAIYNEEGLLLYWSYHTDGEEQTWPKLTHGYNILRSKLPERFLNEGTYRLELIGGLHCRKWLCEPGANAPSINLTIQGNLSDSPLWMNKRPGIIAPLMEWRGNI